MSEKIHICDSAEMTLLELEGFSALRQNSSLKTGRAAAGRGDLNEENTEEEDTETEAHLKPLGQLS